ncbi:MAG: discoidin domain-containing protein, partial [Sedimentisphaerales bacterium]|nr:discoidin domain-containing protein [Sedimentisphaerales bacterium]
MWKKLDYLALVGFVLCFSGRTMAQIITAEELLVDLRAKDLAYGGGVTTWTNRGTLGDFTAVGNPVVEDVDGRKAVTFDGASYFEGPLSVAGITGAGTRSIEVWAYNGPDFVSEETMVSWSHRGGPAGTNMGFNYGNHGTWGAVAHWDAPDMPWSAPHAPAPAAGNWWYLVYTYDGTTVRLYVNAEENTTRAVALNTHGPNIIRVAAQADNSGAGVLSAVNFTGSIAEVRIHDGVLSPSDIAFNFVHKPGQPIARNSSPGKGQTDVPRDAVLSWTASESAVAHDVYFGTSFDDVNAAGRANPLGVLAGQGQTDTTFNPDGLLEFGQTYYWRIDEVNAPPDSTIFTGEVWSFTTEPVTYTIENVVATASTTSAAGEGPERVVDGSGLSPNGQHSNNQAHMWLGNPVGSEPVWIQFDFDKIYKLMEMRLWNYNMAFEAWLGLSAKDVTIEYTSDGTDWTSLGDFALPQGPAVATYEGTVLDLGGIAAQALRINIHSNYGTQKSYGLSEVRFSYLPVQAREPEPADGTIDLEPEVVLSWRPGREAASHEVYLSTDPNAVAEGTALVDTVTDSTYDAGTLDLGATYYWKINEVNEAATPSAWEGALWSFATRPYITIDDFESYSEEEDNQIFDVWIDGYENNANGSLIGHDNPPYVEESIVLSGEQSGPLYYDNTGTATISEATRTFDGAQDWTLAGAQMLVVYFRGSLGNNAGQLYAKVNGTRVDYPGGTDALTAPLWQQWNISLASLGNAAKNVTSFTVGVSGSGKGLAYFDDIRLYRVAPPLPEEPVDPGTANLVAYYAMENNLTDGSGNGYDGTPVMSPSYGPGPTGYGTALVLDGVASYVELPIGALTGSLTDATLGMWVDFSGQGGAWQRIFDFGSGTNRYFFICPARGGDGALLFEVNGPGGGTNLCPAPFTLPSGWHHVAGVIDSANMELRLYFDGALAGQAPTDTLPSDIGETTQNWLGRSQYTADAYFDGSIDDFRIYNRALSA